MRRTSGRTVRSAGAVLAVAFAGLLTAAGAGAEVTCEKPAGEGPMQVIDHEAVKTGAPLTLVRSGNSIDVLAGPQSAEVPCGPGAPDVAEITKISVQSGRSASLTIDLRGGPFAPGAGADTGDPEIEIEGGAATVRVIPPESGADVFDLGELPDGRNGINLNGDGDGNDVTLGNTEYFSIGGGPADDTIDADGSEPYFAGPFRYQSLVISGGGGDDYLSGGYSPSGSVHGGPGDDTLYAGTTGPNSGSSSVYGEEGDDLLVGRDAKLDNLSGGYGDDTLSYGLAKEPVTVSLQETAPQDTGGGGVDNLAGPEGGPSDIENLIGSPFPDALTGSSLPNVVYARDEQADTVSCGDPVEPPDKVFADARGVDAVSEDCETVDFFSNEIPAGEGESAPSPGDEGAGEQSEDAFEVPTESAGDQLGVRAAHAHHGHPENSPKVLVRKVSVPDGERGLLHGGARARVSCSHHCIARVEVRLGADAASRLGLPRTVASASVILAADHPRWVELYLTPEAARAMRRSPGHGRPYLLVLATARSI